MLRRLTIVGLACGLVLPLAACGGGGGGNQRQSSSNAGSTTVTIAGSTALLPLVKQAAADYQAKHANVKIGVSGGGSLVGITQVAQKAIDIGDSDIPPPPSDPNLVDHEVAVVPFGVVVNPKASVKNLTTQQIRGIFTGTIKNFNQAGGANQPITIVNRPRSSGTRAVFVQKIMGGTQPLESGLTQDSSGTVARIVAQTPGAISYLAMGYVKPGQQMAVAIDGVPPTDADVESGKYKFWSYEHMLTNGQPSAQIAGFIDYVKNDIPLLRRLGFLPVGEMKTH
jgi:phosphate transport system substrate-binding protein